MNTTNATTPCDASLVLMVGRDTLDVVTLARVGHGGLTHRRIALDKDVDHLKALQRVIYDTPMLTADYADVTVLADTDRFMIMPPDTTEDEAVERLYKIYPDDDLEVIINRLDCDASAQSPQMVMGLNAGFTGFLRRTYHNPLIQHQLTPLIKYFGLKNRMGSVGKVHMNVDPGRTSVIAFNADGLLLANTYDTPTANDAVYYTLAAARMLNFDSTTDTLTVSGNPQLREQVLPILRNYISMAMPAIFPAALFSAGRAALDAPFQAIASTQVK